jgi:hypothetical protein
METMKPTDDRAKNQGAFSDMRKVTTLDPVIVCVSENGHAANNRNKSSLSLGAA